MNPSTGKILPIPLKEDILSDFTIAETTPELVYFGESASNSQRLYSINLKKNTSVCLKDLSAGILKDVILGEVHDWNFRAAAGDTIYGRYYLPPHFDPNKKYPLIVNYYGGTSPTERSLETDIRRMYMRHWATSSISSSPAGQPASARSSPPAT